MKWNCISYEKKLLISFRYLWWVSEDLEGGLYRFPITPDEPSSEEESQIEDLKPELILKAPDLGGLALDAPNFRVLVADRKNNTMLAVSLDG